LHQPLAKRISRSYCYSSVETSLSFAFWIWYHFSREQAFHTLWALRWLSTRNTACKLEVCELTKLVPEVLVLSDFFNFS
jgi:hypothetical protein